MQAGDTHTAADGAADEHAAAATPPCSAAPGHASEGAELAEGSTEV